MGIKDLWSILTPFSERRPLYELQNKTVAVDLSCWICEAQNVTDYNIQPRMYLRNLYFRTCYLLLMNVQPVFVLEGKAPELKYDTIAERNALQFKGARPKTAGVKTGKDRTRFHFVLKQCEEMLNLMGLACIKGKGEAEALCAYLNEDGLVDGCISQDSDCFAYGARVVYRNFSISQQGVAAAAGGSIDVYDIEKLPAHMRFGRNKIVALALLCGCDYNDGVRGVGKDSVVKLFERFGDGEILERLRAWKSDAAVFERLEREIADKNVCTSCGHAGKVQGHTRNGCKSCGTRSGCDLKYRETRLAVKNELSMRSKALALPDFPSEELITEFLVRKDNVSSLNLKWKRPDITGFMKFAEKFLTWEEDYAFEKFLPILCRWQVVNYKQEPLLKPQNIKKIRNPKGVPCYEIIWSDHQQLFKGLTKELASIEPQELVEKAYPDLVEAFKQSKIKPPKKATKRKKVATKAIDELEKKLQNTSLSEPKVKTAKKTIDSYLKKAVINNFEKKTACSTPIKQKDASLMDLSAFDDTKDDADLSDIIDEIVQQKPDFILNHSFFITEPTENDVFEATFNELCATKPDTSEDDDDEDSFVICEVPLIERLKCKQLLL